jgi:hypothetical protein
MKETIRVINELKKEGLIEDYAIGGAIGVLKWVEPFFTRDLDIFVIPVLKTTNRKLIDFSEIYRYLKTKGYDKWVGQWLLIEGVPMELIPADTGLARESVEMAIETEYERAETRVIAPEYLIALLLVAGRQKDKIKIEMLFNQAKVDIKKLKEITAKYKLSEKLKPFIK